MKRHIGYYAMNTRMHRKYAFERKFLTIVFIYSILVSRNSIVLKPCWGCGFLKFDLFSPHNLFRKIVWYFFETFLGRRYVWNNYQ